MSDRQDLSDRQNQDAIRQDSYHNHVEYGEKINIDLQKKTIQNAIFQI